MTPETHILQELVEAINRPDWWTIGITSAITIINVAIMVWLGVNQYKLQKRQAEVAEYEIYKKLASTIKRIHKETEYIKLDFTHSLTNQSHIAPQQNIWKNRRDLCFELYRQLKDCETDLELKFSKGFINIDAYQRVLLSMMQFSEMLESLLLENKIVQTHQISVQIKQPYIDSIEKLAVRVDSDRRDWFIYRVLDLYNTMDSINEEETLSIIKSRSNIDTK